MLLHIINRHTWEATQSETDYRPNSLATEGFIHLSTPEQVLFPADLFYRGQADLLLLVVDPAKLTAPLQYDSVPGHGTFPHLYGPLNRDAVTEVLSFDPLSDGTFALPEALKRAG